MNRSKEYWLRWFIWGFLVGAIIPSVVVGAITLSIWVSASPLMRSVSESIPIVSNLYIEIVAPGSGKVIASGYPAVSIVSFFAGIVSGVLGLCIAGINVLIRKSPRKPD